MGLDELLKMAALAGVVAAAIVVAAGLPARWPAMRWAHWLGAGAVGIGFAVAFAFFRPVPSLPPADAIEWVFHIALVGAALGIVLSAMADTDMGIARRGRDWARAGIALAALAAATYVVLSRYHHRPVTWGAVLALGSFVIWLAMEWLARRGHGRLAQAALVLVAMACVQVIAESASLRIGQHAAMLAGAAAGALVAGALWRRPPIGGSFVTILLLHNVLLTASTSSEAAGLNLLLLLLAPLGALAALAPGVRTLRGGWRWAIALAAVLIPMGTAQVLAHLAFLQEG